MEHINDDTVITPKFLLENGFIEYHTGDENTAPYYIEIPSELPIYPDPKNRIRVFFQRKFHRNLFVISFQEIEEDNVPVQVWVMNDVGCGYSDMPLRWSELTVGTMNHLYMAFMDEKLFDISSSVITKFEDVGECEVDVKEVVKQWNEKWCISQWHEEYRLCKHDDKADNFTKTSLKLLISKKQAKEIIVELDLMPEQSPIFRNAKTWKKLIKS